MDQIIDSVSGDTQRVRAGNLETCTLVAHAWLPRSSHYQFRLVKIRNSSFSAFIEAVDKSPRLSYYVTRVIVYAGPVDVTSQLQDVLQALPNLRDLEYWGLLWSHYHLPVLSNLHQQLRIRLAHLSISFDTSLEYFARYHWEVTPTDPFSGQSPDLEQAQISAETSSALAQTSRLSVSSFSPLSKQFNGLNATVDEFCISDTYHVNATFKHFSCDMRHLELKPCSQLRSYNSESHLYQKRGI